MEIPQGVAQAELTIKGRTVKLTNLEKPFWPTITKRDLLQYYADISPVLLPHLCDRAMVMKRYPNGARGRVLLHEAHARRAARVAAHLLHHARAPGT